MKEINIKTIVKKIFQLYFLSLKCIVFIFAVFINLIIFSQNDNQKDSNITNFSFLYNPGKSKINPQAIVYNNKNLSSVVFFKQNINELIMLNINNINDIYEYVVEYDLRDAENYNIIDSSRIVFPINKDKFEKSFTSFFEINTAGKNECILNILFFCKHTNANKRFIFEINKLEIFSSQNYLVEVVDEINEIKYDNIVYKEKKYRIISERLQNDSVNVNYYSFDEYMPETPYSLHRGSYSYNEADSSFYYKLGDTIKFLNKGIYFFQASSNHKMGLVLINAGKFFPNIKTLDKMLEPIQYISTHREYASIINSDNIKKEFDEFWYSKSKSFRIAREQIRVYYNRVQLANIYFTDYRQGFKTDRGMIYIIFGAPTVVYLRKNEEEWMYGKNPGQSALSFVFDKSEHPIFEHHYKLRRNKAYQSIWRQAITTWRGGKIFLKTD